MHEKFSDDEMRIIVSRLYQFKNTKGWSEAKLAEKLNIDYTYLYRVLRQKKNVGIKFMMGLLQLCRNEGLDIYDFVNM